MKIGQLCVVIGGVILQSSMSSGLITKSLKEKTRNSIKKAGCFTAGVGSAVLTLYGIIKYNLQYDDAIVSLALSVASGCVVVFGQCTLLKGMYNLSSLLQEKNKGTENDDNRLSPFTPEERPTVFPYCFLDLIAMKS